LYQIPIHVNKKYIDIHTHRISENNDVLSIYNYPIFDKILIDKQQPVSVGLHPWYADKKDNLIFDKIETLARQESTWAIGECGLDRSVSKPMITQMDVFIEHIIISEKVEKPLIIHCVRSFPEIILLKNKYKTKQPWIIHGFNSNGHSIHHLTNHDIYVSFGSQLLTSKRIIDIFSRMPDDKYFLETDDQKAVSIEEIYEQVAFIKTKNVEDIINQQQTNFLKCMGNKITLL